MRVAMYYNNRDVRLEEMPVPPIGKGEVLVKVEASGICGSDVMEWYRLPTAPRVLGHEVAGVIVKLGEGVERYKQGDRVTVSHHVPCNTCHYCLQGNHTACETLLRGTHFDPGGFAEFIRVPAINVDRGLFLLPPEVSFEEATFVEPLGCALRGQRRAGIQPGCCVLVIGSGIAGLLHIQLARSLGADCVVATDIVEYRLKAAQSFGADAAVHAQEDVASRLRRINHGRLADLVIVCTGAPPAMAQAWQAVERGGTILFFAPTEPGPIFPLSLSDFFWRQVTLTTSYGASPADLATAMELIRSRRIRVGEMVTHRLSLAEAGLGFQLVAKAGESIKVIIQPHR